jgi:hypothetical protein
MLAISAVVQHKLSQVQPNPSFDKMKTLAGDWEGDVKEGGESMTTRVVVRVVSDGSAILHELDPGGPYNMITMIHTDGAALLATHYCGSHNQPRMKLKPSSEANSLLFDFMDGTNITPGTGYMQSVKFVFVDADHHYEDWSYNDNGKVSTSRFAFHRKKA